jgi:dihydropteroate synthase-like protein
VILIKILIITGKNSHQILKRVIEDIPEFEFEIKKAPVSVSAFLTKEMASRILEDTDLEVFDLILLPGFVQWDSKSLEKKHKTKIRKGSEFASDLPMIMKNIDQIELSTKISADKLFKISGEKIFEKLYKKQFKIAKQKIDTTSFFINKKRSDVIIGKNLPPPIIAEIVNCPEKEDNSILKKVEHYIRSGADIIDIGCVANKPNPERVVEVIKLIRNHFEVLLSIDSMDPNEILAAVEKEIDLILSFDLGNYRNFLEIPKNIPIVILPTKINEGYFPKDPKVRVKNLLKLTKILMDKGFKKLIADPLLETPIAPGIVNSLQAYYLYKKTVSKTNFQHLELPMFFGISNVVELMDVDSLGINGLLASIAAELNMGILFTVEHSTKMMNGVSELKDCVKLNYIAKSKNSPPINQGIQIFKAKGKTSQDIPKIDIGEAISVKKLNEGYTVDENGYFKIYVDHYKKEIIVLFYTLEDEVEEILIGTDAEAISKKIIELGLTDNPSHLNYMGRELKKAEICLIHGKPYIQDV